MSVRFLLRVALGVLPALTAAVSAIAAGMPVVAQGTTAQIQVQASVVKRCVITSSDVGFGVYDPVTANATSPLDGAGSVTVSCTKGTTARIGIDTGSNSQGGARRMSGAGSFLAYELYSDAGRTDVWTNAGSGLVTVTSASIAPTTLTVYGRIP